MRVCRDCGHGPYQAHWTRCPLCGQHAGTREMVARRVIAPPTLPHNHTETSRAAAERVAPVAGSQRHQVLCAVVAAPHGLTRGEIVALGFRENGVNPRCAELLAAGLLEERGQRDHRAVLYATAAGRQAVTMGRAA